MSEPRDESIEVRVTEETPRAWRSADDLAAFLREENPGFDVEPRHLASIPGWEWLAPATEVIAVYVGVRTAQRGMNAVTDRVVDRIVASSIAWARAALQRERRSWRALLTFGRSARPKRVVIYGPEGEVLRTVVVRKPGSDPEVAGA